ncbi:unnamed protein product [Urochloa humidicola]
MTRAMEALEQIQETLDDINQRNPGVCVAKYFDFVLHHRLGIENALSEGDTGGAGHRRRAECSGSAPRALRMDWAACVLPCHGEDAHFGHAEAGFVGVADGVGGYRDHGIDAGAFARELMESSLAKVELAASAHKLRRLHPKNVLENAYERAVINGTPGASTAIILSLDRTALRWAYIGDSAFAVLRGGNIIYRSLQQQHYFNCPYQLSSNGNGDSLAEAKVGGMSGMMDGDVLVLGTDGLFDNMNDRQLERAVSMGMGLGFSPKNMADIVAGIAYKISTDNLACTPYSTGYSKAQGNLVYGGKKDDITVIVAYIVPKDS